MSVNRRSFLKSTASLSTVGALQGLGVNLVSMAEANAATDNPNDYKALVGIFLAGGNDNGNTMFPIDNVNYPLYQAFRPDIAIPKNKGIALNPEVPLPNGVQYALNPNLSGLAQLFNSGDMAILQNVGTLTMPTTKAIYQTQYASLPPKLYSHIDQQKFWQMSTTDYKVGWGSAIASKMVTRNSIPLFSGVSVNSPMPALANNTLNTLTLGENGANPMIGFYGGTTKLFGINNLSQYASQMMNTTNNNNMEKEISDVFTRSVYSQQKLLEVFDTSSTTVNQFFTNGEGLSNQLKAVAKMIKSREALGMKRQVFIVSMGGFDLHSGMSRHGDLLKVLNDAIVSFNKAMHGIGMNDNVTLFTMSDFGRTLNSNNGGTDHGWGSHHFIVGGAVKGKQIYGKTPSYVKDSEDDVGRGRFIPSTSTAQYIATLAKWFGVNDSDISTIVPYINNFPQKTLNFV